MSEQTSILTRKANYAEVSRAMKKFKLVTLGCRTNQYETEAYRKQLVGLGFQEVSDGEEASVCVVNTCTVTAAADSSSRHQIRKLKRENPDAKVIVTGCLVDNQKTLVEEIEGIQLVPNKEKHRALSVLFSEKELPEFSINRFEGHTRAFVKVQDGCNSFCSYCIIPYVRGRSRSRTIAEVVKEVEELVENGYKEVVITGINVGDFDGQSGETLADLIRALDKVSGLKRLRVSSIDPDEVDDNLMGAIIDGKNTCPSMHIVLQSGSNIILKKMRRKYTRQCFLDTIEKLKKACADFTFTTDVIVGFPGETEGDFEETLAVIEEVKFAKVHMFPYSQRERTKAYFFPDQVPIDVIQERKERLLKLADKVAFDLRNEYLNKKMDVLLENGDDTMMWGHTSNFLTVMIPKKKFHSNEMVTVEMIENKQGALLGAP